MKFLFEQYDTIYGINNAIRVICAIKWLNLCIIGLILAFVSLTGCVSQKSDGNISQPGNIPVSSSSLSSLILTTHLQTPNISHETSDTLKKKDDNNLAQNETAYFQQSNITFELSLGDISLRKSNAAGNLSNYNADINMTIKNTGKNPFNVTILVSEFMDDSGDGCHTNLGWCYGKDPSQIYPGNSKNIIVNITFSSVKEFKYLASQKYRFTVSTPIETNKTGIYGHQFSWIIEMKTTDG
jgi:hypothetical protein